MDQHDGAVLSERGGGVEELKLYGRAGEAFDAVDAGGVQEHPPGAFGAEPPDVDAERRAVGAARVDGDRIEPASGGPDFVRKRDRAV